MWHLQIFLSVLRSCQHFTCLTLTFLPPPLSYKVAFTGQNGTIRGGLSLCLPHGRLSGSWPHVLSVQSRFWSEMDLRVLRPHSRRSEAGKLSERYRSHTVASLLAWPSLAAGESRNLISGRGAVCLQNSGVHYQGCRESGVMGGKQLLPQSSCGKEILFAQGFPVVIDGG